MGKAASRFHSLSLSIDGCFVQVGREGVLKHGREATRGSYSRQNSQRARTFITNSEFSHRKGHGGKDIFLLVRRWGNGMKVPGEQREKLTDLKVRCDSEKQ